MDSVPLAQGGRFAVADRTRLAFVLGVAGLAACSGGMAKREAQQKAAMLVEAKAIIAEESAYVAESLAFMATFTTDTVAARFDSVLLAPPADANDGSPSERHWYVRSTHGRVCEVELVLHDRLAVGDTLRCQWSAPK